MTMFQQDFFESTAQRLPDAIAIDDHGKTVTYGALDERANRIGHWLRAHGCGPNQRVCLYLNKDANLYAALLGTLKAGGCWVPLSPEFPAERLVQLLGSLTPVAVVVDKAGLAVMTELRRQTGLDFALLVLGDGTAEAELETCPAHRPGRDGLSAEDMAYIIFTSGSTGVPKGVVVLHRNTATFLALCPQLFPVAAGERFAHFSQLTFDPSVFDLFHCWATGGTLVPFNRRSYRIDPGKFLIDQRINVLFTVPSVIAAIRDAGRLEDPALDGVRHLLLTGEAIPSRLVHAWYAAHPGSRLHNMYGTTETAIISHHHLLDPAMGPDDPVPVGRPLPTVDVMLIDGDRPAAPGEAGESVVRGIQVSPGYWNDPDQTSARHVPHPLVPGLPGTVYRTGDLLRLGADGLHYYVGREDAQVKVRGHRVELAEVELALRRHPAITDCAVVAVAADGYNAHLAAYCEGTAETGGAEMRAFLRGILPPYMVPAAIQVMAALPRNANGKIDRQTLRREAEQASKESGNEH